MGAPVRPSLVTILFTDLVGSTALRTSLGEEAADELRRSHDDLLTRAIEAHGGWVVKGSGDGLLAAFASAADALSAAIAGQQALMGHNRSAGALAELRVRMGLSVGDVAWDNDDCFGTPVIEAARLEAEAESGQILCSEYVKTMARGRGGHRLIDVGMRSLKGLAEPLGVYEVEWNVPEAAEPSPQIDLPPALIANTTTALVGREQELAECGAWLDGPGLRTVLIFGETGIGKTRLASEVAVTRHRDGAIVLFGRCDEDIATPFQPVIEALTHWATRQPADELSRSLGRGAGQLSRLYPDLLQLIPGLEEPPEVRDGNDSYRIFEAVRAWLSALGEREVVLVFDDVQWATLPTLQLLRHLQRHPEPPDVKVVLTSRPAAELGREVARLVDELVSAPQTSSVDLAGLSEGDVAELVGGDREVAVRVVAETGGNALFVTTVVASGGLDGTLPSDVRAAVRRRLAQLGPPERELLELCAVAGQVFDLRAIAAGLSTPLTQVALMLQELLRRSIVDQPDATSARFSHGLVRTAILEDLGATQRALLHQQYALGLEATPGPDVMGLAYHWRAAADVVDDRQRVADALANAASTAVNAASLDQAVEMWSLASEFTDVDEASIDYRLRAGDAARRVGRFVDARRLLEGVHEDAQRGGLVDEAVKAAVWHAYSSYYPGGSVERSLELTTAVLNAATTDPELRVQLLLAHAIVLAHSGRDDEATSYLEQGLELGASSDDPWLLHVMSTAAFQILRGPERAAELTASLYEISPRIEATANAFQFAAHRLHLGYANTRFNRLRPSQWWVEVHDTMNESAPDHFVSYDLLNNAAVSALMAGEFEEAERLAERSLRLGEALDGLDATGVYGVQMFAIRREQGRLAEIGPLLEVLLKRQNIVWQPGLAVLYSELGRVADCRAILTRTVSESGVDLPSDDRRGVSLSYLASAASVAGDQGAAATLHRELVSYQGLNLLMHSTTCAGPADRVLGTLSRVLGDLDRSVSELESAVSMGVAGPSPVFEARSRHDLALSLSRRGGAGDTAAAREHLDVALTLAQQLRMAGLVQDVNRLAEQLRV